MSLHSRSELGPDERKNTDLTSPSARRDREETYLEITITPRMSEREREAAIAHLVRAQHRRPAMDLQARAE
jgi:hypothetical protein